MHISSRQAITSRLLDVPMAIASHYKCRMCDWVVLPRHSCRDCGIQSNAIGISSGLAHPPFCDLVFKHGIETKVDPVSLRVNVCSCLSTVIFFHGQFALEIILVVGIKDVQLMNGLILLQNFLRFPVFSSHSLAK